MPEKIIGDKPAGTSTGGVRPPDAFIPLSPHDKNKVRGLGFHRDALEAMDSREGFYFLSPTLITEMKKAPSITEGQYRWLKYLYARISKGLIPFPSKIPQRIEDKLHLHHDVYELYKENGFNPYGISALTTGRSKALLMQLYRQAKSKSPLSGARPSGGTTNVNVVKAKPSRNFFSRLFTPRSTSRGYGNMDGGASEPVKWI